MDTQHTNPQFDTAIGKMEGALAQMEDAVAAQMEATRRLFDQMDVATAKKICGRDQKLNALAQQVEDTAVLVLARHQPVAEDLRHVVGALKMATEYERAADYVKNLAKSIGRLAAHDERLRVLPSLANMMQEAEAQFLRFVKARRAGDLTGVERVWIKDRRIDELCDDAVREAFDNQKGGEGNAHSLIHAVFIAKNAERIGDKIKNLAEIYYRQKKGEDLNIETDD